MALTRQTVKVTICPVSSGTKNEASNIMTVAEHSQVRCEETSIVADLTIKQVSSLRQLVAHFALGTDCAAIETAIWGL